MADHDEARAAADVNIVRQALAGSQPACEELVRRFERPVFNLIVRMVRDESTAEDLAQDTFIKIFRGLASYNQSMRLVNWVLRIAHNTAIDHLRQRRLAVLGVRPDDDGESDPLQSLPDLKALSPEHSSVRAELATAVDRALDQLRPEYRSVVVLRYQEGLEYQEIAEILDMPLGTVKTFLHRARRALAAELARAGWAPETRPGGRS